jgi:phosphate/phosphite/phosphonate ABC transporter binding protein
MKLKRMSYLLVAVLVIASFAMAACQPAAPAAPEEPAAAVEEPVAEEPMEEVMAVKVCQVTDVGGIDDKSFNATAWKGIEDAMADYGVEGKYLESQQQTDYEVNINAFLEDGCDLIITVGFLLADATAAAAGANPDQLFASIDVDYLEFPNLRGSGFAINQATFLNGYLAAAMTETGVVATYTGIIFPATAYFMDGFVYGVRYYNEMNDASVKVLGWSPEDQDGLAVGNFESTDDGRSMGESLMDEGADVIMPVAGPVGLGTLAVMEERGSGMLIGVDNDWSLANPDKADYILSSAMKNMDLFVHETAGQVVDGAFESGNWIGTLENGGVGIAYGSAWEGKIDADVKAEIADLQTKIIAGEIGTKPGEEGVPAAMAGPELGSADRPIKVLFVPSVEADVIVTGGEVMADALKEATGMEFEVLVPTSYAATIEEMCASPADTMGFIPGLGYVLANQLCGVDVSFAAVRFGSSVYWAQVLVQRDSEFQTLEDLNGASWGLTDPGSTSGYMTPLAMFQDAGIEIGEQVETGGHTQAVKAVYNGEVDFATTYYSQPINSEYAVLWSPGDEGTGDVPEDLVDSCGVNDTGRIWCGDWRPMDARPNIREEAPDVIQKVRILALSPAIPNDTLSFGPEFDPALRTQIEEALVAFAETDAWSESIGSDDFYSWTGIAPALDADYDFVRLMVDAVGLTLEGLGE